jgi:hypothetical protein
MKRKPYTSNHESEYTRASDISVSNIKIIQDLSSIWFY